ncbi:MAG: DUF2169 domain-containing protein [Myxococcota bacterium]
MLHEQPILARHSKGLHLSQNVTIMRVVNHTNFTTLIFKAANAQGHIDWVVVIKGTFKLAAGRVETMTTQPVRCADMYYSGPQSSLAFAADVVAYKPRSEVHVFGRSQAHMGSATRTWTAAVVVGELRSAVRITGPRAWVRRGDRYELSDPEACKAVELRYELAYGGTCNHCKKFEPSNPIGRGLRCEDCEDIKSSDMIPAPQIEPLEEPTRDFGATYTPGGLSPVPPSWMPRRKFAGTYDMAWKETIWPRLPEDFDERFNNSAPLSLQRDAPFKGDEEVRLTGIYPEGEIACELSGIAVILSLALCDGVYCIVPRLDTISFDLDNRTISQIWRARIPEGRRLRYVGIRTVRTRR